MSRETNRLCRASPRAAHSTFTTHGSTHAHRNHSCSLHLRQRQVGSDGNLPCLPDAFHRSGKEATPEVLITTSQVPKSQSIHRPHSHLLCVNGIKLPIATPPSPDVHRLATTVK